MVVLGTAGQRTKNICGSLFFIISTFFLGVGPLLATISVGHGAMAPLDLP